MGVSVVIADDHASFRRLARRLLETAGYSVVGEASDGESTLAAVAKLRPDVVLLDVLLPDAASGFSVADQIVSEAGEPPVVLLTSSRSAADYGAAVTGRRFLPKSDLTPERIEAPWPASGDGDRRACRRATPHVACEHAPPLGVRRRGARGRNARGSRALPQLARAPGFRLCG